MTSPVALTLATKHIKAITILVTISEINATTRMSQEVHSIFRVVLWKCLARINTYISYSYLLNHYSMNSMKLYHGPMD